MAKEIGQIQTELIPVPFLNTEIAVNPQTIFNSCLVIVMLLGLGLLLRYRLKLLPGRRQLVLELLIGWFDKVTRESLGEDSRKFLPLIITLFLFVLFSNWISVIPGLKSPTADINTCLGLGLLVFFVSHASAIRAKGLKRYLKGYFEPIWILFPSNVISEFSKVLSHSFRLFGNMFAGGIIIAVIPIILVNIFKIFGIPLGILGMPLINAFFGLFIGGIQAFVFAMLALAYIAVLRES
jgi:F-type H+-transporting ATPase subunit a